MNKTTHPYFIANGESRRETAILLVGTAEEYGIDQREVRAVRGGFRITKAVADALDLDTTETDETDEAEADEAEADEAEADEAEADEAEAMPYDEWDYAALKAEVAGRDLPTEDKKAETLIAALIADDNASGNRAGENEE